MAWKIFRARAEIFRLLFGVTDRELHVREIERRTGLTIGTVRQELGKLERTELVNARRDGNRLYYSANKEHPFYPGIHSLVVKTAGLVDFRLESRNLNGFALAHKDQVLHLSVFARSNGHREEPYRSRIQRFSNRRRYRR